MASEPASWSPEDIAETIIHDALSEFEDAKRGDIERARADGKARTWFPLEKKLEEIMKELSKEFRSKYPTATFRVGHPLVIFTSRRHVPLPGCTKTGYVVLKSIDLKEGSIRWGEDLEDIREGYYIPFGVK